jgi:hypothetical protein
VSAHDWPAAPRLPGPPDPADLPLDPLPPVLRGHVVSVAGATQTPPDMGAMLALAAVSAATAGRAVVHVDHTGWNELVTIYTAAVLPPASRKSPVYALMTQPLVEWEREARARIAPEYGRARAAADLAADRLAAARKGARNGGGDTLDAYEAARIALVDAEELVPILPRLLAGDVTPEGLVRLMGEQRGPIALMAPEADPIKIADGRYENAPRLDELCRAWSGERITSDRAGRDSIIVDFPCLTMGLCMQPDVLEGLRHARAFTGQGLMGRILWCRPEHGLGTRLTGRRVPPLDTAAADRYARALLTLLDTARPETPHALRVTDAALEALYDFAAAVEADLADGGRLAGIREWAGKSVGQAVRLAALLELAARADDGRSLWAPVGPSAVRGGVRLVRALTTHALHVLGTTGMDAETADLVYLLRRIREIPIGSTVRDLHVAVQGRANIRKADSPSDYLAELLDGLVERGCIRLVPQQSTGGRPPSPVIELHPSLVADPVEATRPVAEVVL